MSFLQKPQKPTRKEFILFPLSKTVSPSSWILLLIGVSILTALILWVTFGLIPITITGKGVIISEGGFTSLQSATKGTITEILIGIGDRVKQGDPLLKTENEASTFTSPFDAQVLEVLVQPGDLVQEGTHLLWVELFTSENQKALIYGYFPIDSGKRLQVNSPVLMTIPSVNKNKYGAIKGTIKSVSPYAESKASLLNEIQNRALVDYLSDQMPGVVKVIIEPRYKDKEFLWTSHAIPPQKITTGTVGILEATVEEVKPLYYLIPLPQFKNKRVRDDA